MPNSITETINRVAPILRMLLSRDNACPIVRLIPSAQECNETGVNVAVSDDLTDEQIIELLSNTINQQSEPINALGVKDVGVFKVIHPDTYPAGRVAGKVAIVTGAAQGIGLEIARELAREGACIVLADIYADEATKQAQQIQQHFGADRAMALATDVTESDSITNAVHEVVKHYGGLDIFISNAGVLKSESVKTQTEQDFDFVSAVNYKGYFLCTQVVAKVLALQHKARPDYLSDIIQINSKSGLAGSNRNAAYAGSKFGGIGLTQSFALELIEDGIKVNAVCPGNFFDGPLWSNPENGLLVQYLHAGKVPGAKTIKEVRRAYEDKIPMRRGCTIKDVMKAIFYLIEQSYETGQAVPVTGGQIMLH
ncbi:MAG: SDR family NAD(P)-dependent oxidoreductase [Sedimentisphaerales bacterium]|nr:SDR family NAD(P)-dependent oxidoreductase [Sedimentisphaerales bacterium]